MRWVYERLWCKFVCNETFISDKATFANSFEKKTLCCLTWLHWPHLYQFTWLHNSIIMMVSEYRFRKNNTVMFTVTRPILCFEPTPKFQTEKSYVRKYLGTKVRKVCLKILKRKVLLPTYRMFLSSNPSQEFSSFR